MLSFHGDSKVKQKYLERVKLHQKLDQVIQGSGWNGEKGCAIGCILEKYDHSLFPKELGMPVWLANLVDKIHEGLPLEKAKKWPAAFIKNTCEGITEEQFEQLRHKLAVIRQKRNLKLQKKNKLISGKLRSQILQAIQTVIDYHSNPSKSAAESAAESARSAAWSAVRSAESARSAAESAESAARSAAWSARSAAWSAAESAESAARSAAWSAVRSAESAAWSARSAAWSAVYIQESKDLLKLLRELKQ